MGRTYILSPVAHRDMPIRLSSSHYKVIAAALTVAVISFLISDRYFHKAFPEASLELRINRSDSESIGWKFLRDRGYVVDNYRHAAIFTYDTYGKLYIERRFGLERLNQLALGTVPLWRWSNRWYRPEQQEEFNVDVSPNGEVVGFHHVIPETQAGKDLEFASARAIAESFLTQIMKRNLGDMEFLESRNDKRPARTDYTLTWKQTNLDLGDGSLRTSISISGDQVSGYSEFVYVPEEWGREYERIRSRNESAQTVDTVFYSFLSIAMFVMLVVRLRNHDVPIRSAAGFGLATGLLYFCSQMNNFPLAEAGYQTTESYASFVASYVTGNILSALGVAAFIFFLVGAGEPEYRDAFPAMISVRRYFSWKALRTRSFLLANVVGLAMAFFFFAYQTVFYLCANKLGAWAPSDLPFTNELNTRIPWLSVVFMGVFPAVSEEMQFRGFAIPFLSKRLRSVPIAIILSAFNWGFLHSAYPNEPFFIRGLEVGLGGILIGFIMVRFGILATLIWHYSVDALYSAFLLLRSPNHYLKISGALTAGMMLIPLATAIVAYLCKGTFEDEATLTNGEQKRNTPSQIVEADEAVTTMAYQSTGRMRTLPAGILIVVATSIALFPVYRFGQGVKLKVTAGDAITAANHFLQEQGINPATYHHVADVSSNVAPFTVRYLLEHLSIKQTDELYRSATQMATWEVRYFRPLEVTEHRVIFDATNGKFVDHRVRLDENAPGKSLSSDEARVLAEKALGGAGYRLTEFDLQDWRGEKHKAREDYTFVWQAKAGDPRNVGDEHYRVEVDIAGDEVTSLSDQFKLPEDWVRKQFKRSTANSVLEGVGTLLGVIVLVRIVILFVKQLRARQIPWGISAKVGGLFALLSAAGELNSWATIERSYSTSVPLSIFWLQTAVSLVLVPIFVGLGGWLLVALALSVFPEGRRLMHRPSAEVWRRDAFLVVFLGVVILAALSNLRNVVSAAFPGYAPPTINLIPGFTDTWSPALGVLLSAVTGSISSVAGLAVVVAIFREGWQRRTWWFWLCCILLLVSAGPANAHSIRAFLVFWLSATLSFGVCLWIALKFFRDNALAYVCVFFAGMVAKPIIELVSQDARFFLWNGILLGFVSLMMLGWCLAPRKGAFNQHQEN